LDVHNLPKRMHVSVEAAMKLTGGLEPQSFVGLVNDEIIDFPIPRYY